MKVVRSRWSVVKVLQRFALGAMLLALSFAAQAQQPARVPRIGFLSAVESAQQPHVEAFRQGLRELGSIDGKNIVVEWRYADGKLDRVSELASELVRLKVDIIVTGGAQATRAAKEATTTIPIVMVGASDPVGTGIIKSLARPGGNLTGLSDLAPELNGKRLELLKEIVPKVSRVAVLRGRGALSRQMEGLEPVARFLRLQLLPLEAGGASDLDGAFEAAIRGRAQAIMTLPQPFPPDYRNRILELAAKHHLPAIYERNDAVEAGGLAYYGTNLSDLYRRAAFYVDKILKGAKPGDLPVEQPTKFELVINLKAAKQIGLTIPPNVLARAGKVIK